MKNPSLLILTAALTLCFNVCAADAPQGAMRHAEKGVACASCHGADNSVAYPSIDQCRTCHDPKAVAEKTKNVKPQNPHQSPHYGTELDCVLCHVQHGETENYCDQCHTFKYKVP